MPMICQEHGAEMRIDYPGQEPWCERCAMGEAAAKEPARQAEQAARREAEEALCHECDLPLDSDTAPSPWADAPNRRVHGRCLEAAAARAREHREIGDRVDAERRAQREREADRDRAFAPNFGGGMR
jgi:hypothetical protein